MVRKKFRGSNVPQRSSHELDQNFIDTNYEEFDDRYNDQYSHNNRWNNRAYNARRYAVLCL